MQHLYELIYSWFLFILLVTSTTTQDLFDTMKNVQI